MKRIFSAGNVALFLCIGVTGVWTLWGVSELFHEGWYAPFEWLFYLLPALGSLAITLIALTYPRVGGWLLIGIGVVFYGWVLASIAARFGLSLISVLAWFPVSGLLVVIGILFLRWEPYAKTESRPARRLRYLLAAGIPLIIGVGFAIEPAIRIANRVDDGNYGARQIAGNGVTLIWAPAGPGWAASVTWNELALYGLPPVGFAGKADGLPGGCDLTSSAGCATAQDMQRYNACLYLSADGSRLETTAQSIWRMPTTDEVVRSLVHHGEQAGCAWNGQAGAQPCASRPDKETPLWNPRAPIIYLWTADEASAQEAYYVVYHGTVGTDVKSFGLGSRGFRCVHEVGR